MKELDFDLFLSKTKSAREIGLTAPAGADGDSVGTQISLYFFFSKIFPEKKIRIINEEPCPSRYLFLKGSEHFEVSGDLLKTSQSFPDLMICVDGGSNRLGESTTEIWKKTKMRAQVDHHAVGAVGDYDFRLYNPEAAATVEIVYEFMKSRSFALTSEIAQALYVGLIFDTGMFKHPNTTPRVMRMGAELLELGFNHTETAEKALLIRNPAAFGVLQKVLASASFDLGGRYVWSVLRHSDFQALRAHADDREGVIDHLFLTQSCEIAAFYFEKAPGEWKISFRSRGWDVASLARSLAETGGGHRLAAGCSLKGTEQEVLGRCHLAVKECFESQKFRI